jgi:hypothetical protein
MKINENVVASTQDWLKETEGLQFTTYDPSVWTPRMVADSEVVEPGKAVNLSAAERARMNQAKPGAGARMKPERL